MKSSVHSILHRTLKQLLLQGQEKARELKRPVLVSLTQDCPESLYPLSLFAAAKTGLRRMFWSQPERKFWLVGIGQAVEVKASGPDSLMSTASARRDLLSTAIIQTPGGDIAGPLCLGGFRYDVKALGEEHWRDFPDASLVWPRFLFGLKNGRTWLTIATLVDQDTDCDLLDKTLHDQAQSLQDNHSGCTCQRQTMIASETGREVWKQRVEAALQAIHQDQLSKVVLSRVKTIVSPNKFCIETALEHLSRYYSTCTIFAFDSGSTSFLGATPESLARVEDGRLNLQCLASSTPRGSTPDEDQKLEQGLLSNAKELREHVAVLVAQVEALQGICGHVQHPSQPVVWKLPNVQHLLTPISAVLTPGKGLLDLVKALHPTPAVAGTPTAEALDFIRCWEGDRGWYGAPVGWMDHQGNGEFVVAIRSGLCRGNKATMYAGAGIVEGSQTDQEFEETEIKFRPMLSALGVKGSNES